ncbi:hypothetical protein ACP4OV_011209 [Aristida adscensionis]
MEKKNPVDQPAERKRKERDGLAVPEGGVLDPAVGEASQIAAMEKANPVDQPAERKRKEKGGEGAPNKGGGVDPAAAEAKAKKLLAGYLAHEFLRRGTLLGRKIEAGRERTDAEREEDRSAQQEVVAKMLEHRGDRVPDEVAAQLAELAKK